VSWKAYRVTVTRLIEETAEFYVRAANDEVATDKALDEAEEVAEGIWTKTDCKPHSYDVVKCEEADKPKEFT